MSKISDFADTAVQDIDDDDKRRDEKYRIIGLLEEKKQLYISSGCTDDDAEKMAFAEFESISDSLVNKDKVKSNTSIDALRSKSMITCLKVLKYIMIAECVFFGVMMIMSLIRPANEKLVDFVSFLCSLLCSAVPIFVVGLYNKATKDMQRIFLIIISLVFLLFATYRVIGVILF